MLNTTFCVAKCLFKIEATHLNFRTATGYVQLAFAALRHSTGIRVAFSCSRMARLCKQHSGYGTAEDESTIRPHS
ncbi:hypothetical protein T08_1993 [Trichinella sp. T8]|nr:hypothetical protein T08_1993 [Trichinella sp. T8]